jgi:hypothetical protein
MLFIVCFIVPEYPFNHPNFIFISRQLCSLDMFWFWNPFAYEFFFFWCYTFLTMIKTSPWSGLDYGFSCLSLRTLYLSPLMHG